MRITLVSPPASVVTGPCRDIALLKAYLAEHIAEAEIRIVDSSLTFFEWIGRQAGRNAEERERLRGFRENHRFLKRKREVNDSAEEYKRREGQFLEVVAEKAAELDHAFARYLLSDDAAPPRQLLELGHDIYRDRPQGIVFFVSPRSYFYFVVALTRWLKDEYGVRAAVFGEISVFNIFKQQKRRFQELFELLVREEPFIPVRKFIESLGSGQGGYPGGSSFPRTTESDYIADLDVLPLPDYSDIDFDAYPTPAVMLPLYTARGCAWRKCVFCVSPAVHPHMRYRSLAKVGEELEEYVRSLGIRLFAFQDEYITPSRLRALSSEIIGRNLDIRYTFMARPGKGYTRQVMDLCYESGGRYVYWGVESGSQRILDIMCKGTRVESISRSLKNSHGAGLLNTLFIIIGFPGETEKDYELTERLLAESSPYIYMIRPRRFFALTGMKMLADPQKYGIRVFPAIFDRDTVMAETAPFLYLEGNSEEGMRERFQRHIRYCTDVLKKRDYVEFPWDPNVWKSKALSAAPAASG